VWRVAILLCVTAVAWLSSLTIASAVLVGLISVVSISAGYTKWENIYHQIVRGALPCFLIISGLLLLGHPLQWWQILSVLGLHIAGFAVYFGIDKIKPVLGFHFEQVCRFIQGFAVCLAGALV
jgi:hypothetical protein